eukprot:COSAG02_NODE_3227_length_7144_cov_17.684247_4_plen_845_part_00
MSDDLCDSVFADQFFATDEVVAAFANPKRNSPEAVSPGTDPKRARVPEDGPVLTETDLYRLLGVERDADDRAIKKAYYRMALRFHPDKCGNAEDFKKLQRAYEVLSDSEQRRGYDATGRVGSEDDGMEDDGSEDDGMGVDPFDDMFPPATWTQFEGTVYARDANEDFTATDAELRAASDSSDEDETDDEQLSQSNLDSGADNTRARNGDDDNEGDDSDVDMEVDEAGNESEDKTDDEQLSPPPRSSAASASASAATTPSARVAPEAGNESEDKPASKPTPFQVGVRIVQQLATTNGYAKELLPKLKYHVPVRKANCNFCEIMTQRVNDVDMPLTMNDMLNLLAREEPRLNALLNKHANLRKQLVSWMQTADTPEFPAIHRSSCCLDYTNGVLQWGPGDRAGTMTISFWEHDDQLAPQLIARAHIEADFDTDWLRQDVDALLRDSPHFKAFIESKYSPDEICPFGFKTGREGDTMDVSVRDAWLGFHGRLLIPLRLLDSWRCGNYDFGVTGSGKTVVYELIESYHGAAYCQTLQDADHRDKFTINSRTAQLRMLTAQDFGKGEPVTAAQAQKMLSGEKTGTRDMQEVAGESQWKVPVWFIGNFPPPWADDSGALNNRLLLWYWEQQDGPADDSMLSKMLNEPRIALILLKAYKLLHGHIKTTPSQQWSYGYFEKTRKESAAHTVPFIAFLQCGSFTHNGATYTIAAEEGATTLKSRVEDVFKLYMESTQRSAQDIRVCDLKSYLAQASQAPVLRLVEKKNLWKCLECGETVLEEGDESNCDQDCSYQCPPGVFKEDHPRRKNFYKPRDKAGSKVWRTSKTLGGNMYIKNVRVTDDVASMYPTDEE